MKLIKIIPVLAMMLIVLMVGCKDNDENIEGSSVPTVNSTMPGDKDLNVAHNTNIVATFSEEMAPSSISASTFMVKQGATDISGSVEYAGLEATFTPSEAFEAGSEFTVTITSSAKSMKEVNLEADYEWNFTTQDAPTVISTMPANNDIDIALNANLVVTFSEEMDPSTLNKSTFTVKQGNTDVSGTIEYSGLIATFIPSVAFDQASEFTASIIAAAKSLKEVNLKADYEWNFTTLGAPSIASTVPSNNDIDVARNTNLLVTFSEEMDPSTINTSTFTVKQGNTDISGTIEYSGLIATFIPSVAFDQASEFTATITSAAKSNKDVNLEADYEWNFTTEVVPTVISTLPANNDIKVARNANIVVTFSEEMDPSTFNASTFMLKQGTTDISGDIEYTGVTATFNPSVVFDAASEYTVTITSDAKSLKGVNLEENFEMIFTTGGSGTGIDGVNLGSAGNYVILSKTAINNGGTSAITGDLGLSPAATSYITGLALTDYTGYATSSQVTGKVYAADMADPTPINLTTTVENMITAYDNAAGRSEIDFLELGTGNIGGKTLSPGVYKWTNTVSIPTDVTLSGSSTDVWIFQIAENLTMSAATRINLTGGANVNNIFWQVAGEVTIGTTSHFEGIILSKTGITFQTGASINGRALAQTAVILDGNAVTQPTE